jgi:hypothetical protein
MTTRRMHGIWSGKTAVLALIFATTASRAGAQTFSGDATGAVITVPATGTTIRAATGTVPISGGGAEAALLVGDVPGSATGGVVALAAGEMHSGIVGLDATRSEASMANVALTVSGNQISAAFVLARSAASCGPATSGSAQVTNLVINNQSITVTGNPNQTVTLPNGTVVINHQTSSIVGTSAALTVKGVHVTTTDPITHQQVADVVLGEVEAQIDCSGGAPPSGGFGTGGGWVFSNFSPTEKANFGVVGGIQPDGTFRGHVVYEDHGTGFKMKSATITNVTSSACDTRIDGMWNDANAGLIPFYVVISDVAEPGANNDQFFIDATTYANNNTTLQGGNIQSHPNCH